MAALNSNAEGAALSPPLSIPALATTPQPDSATLAAVLTLIIGYGWALAPIDDLGAPLAGCNLWGSPRFAAEETVARDFWLDAWPSAGIGIVLDESDLFAIEITGQDWGDKRDQICSGFPFGESVASIESPNGVTMIFQTGGDLVESRQGLGLGCHDWVRVLGAGSILPFPAALVASLPSPAELTRRPFPPVSIFAMLAERPPMVPPRAANSNARGPMGSRQGFGHDIAPRAPIVFSRHGDGCSDEVEAWLLKGLIPSIGVGIIGGESGSAKTFVAISLATHLAIAEDFLGWRMKGEPIGTALLLGEGHSTIRKRLEAISKGMVAPILAARENAGADRRADAERLPISYAPIDAIDGSAALKQIKDAIKNESEYMLEQHGVRLGVVILDTLPACFAVQDENSAAEMTRAIKMLDEVAREHGVFVIATHHASKANSAGLRGSSAIYSSADLILIAEVQKNPLRQVTRRTLTLEKTRDGEPGWRADLRLQDVQLGFDRDGDPIRSAYIEHVTDAPREVSLQRGPRLSPAGQDFMTALNTVLSGGERMRPFGGEEGPLLLTVDLETVRPEFYARAVTSGETHQQRQDAKKKAFKRGCENATQKGRIATREIVPGQTVVWIVNDEANLADQLS